MTTPDNYTLPDGTRTKNKNAYYAAWEDFSSHIVRILGCELVGVKNNEVVIYNVKLKETVAIPLWLCTKLISLERKP